MSGDALTTMGVRSGRNRFYWIIAKDPDRRSGIWPMTRSGTTVTREA